MNVVLQNLVLEMKEPSTTGSIECLRMKVI